jgi:hypothetical protein
MDRFHEMCAASGIQNVFHQQSDLECPIEPTDLLFIDTWHVYGHLKRELDRWHEHVAKYIILHDTTVDAEEGESIRMGHNISEKAFLSGIPEEEVARGLWPAVEEFVAAHPEWFIAVRYMNNNGLTVLERIQG